MAQTTISEAREMKTGKIVNVRGRVTAAKELGDLSFIQDRTGGIALYGVLGLSLNDSISATGKLAKFNGMIEVVVDSIKILSTDLPPVVPEIVRSLNDHEGELVKLENIHMELPGLFFYPQRAGMIIRESDTIQYWIDEDTDIPGYTIPETSNITGIFGRFGNTLQLLPRSHLDIDRAIIEQPPASNHYFRVMNWNVEFLGAQRYGPSNDTLQVSNVARVLNKTQPDIVALQEVSDDEAFRSLIDRLPGYDGRCSSRYSYSFDPSGDFPPQKLCFVYKTSTVKVTREKILFRKEFDEHLSDMFSGGRLPYLLEVDVGERHLLLINLHGKSGAGEADYIRRASDASILKDSIDRFYSDKLFILLGDLNDDVDQSIVIGNESPYEAFVSDYHCISKTLGDAHWHSTLSYDDMIDHQVISSTLNDHHVSTRIVNTFSLIPLYGKTTSDHLPVISEFDFSRIVTGIDDKQLAVFPNPTTDLLWFDPGPDITVINSVGEIVLKKQGAHPPISLGEYAPGLYSVVLGHEVFRIVRN